MARLQRPRAPRRTDPSSFHRHRKRLAALGVIALAVLPFQALSGAVPASAATTLVGDPASLVNPLIGTSGSVDTFPGPDMPSGMLQWSPDTTPDRPDGGGYEYNDSKISGFSLTHLSGPGCGAGGDVPILPVTGPLSGNLSNTSAGFSHSDEKTGIGYYGVTDSSGITTQLTTTTRAGLGTFTFPGNGDASDSSLLLKLSGGATPVDGTRAQTVGDDEVVGAVQSGQFCGAKNSYTLHFDIKFSQPFVTSGTWNGSTINQGAASVNLGRAPLAPSTPHPNGPQREPHFTVPSSPPPTIHGSEAGKLSAAGVPVTGANGMYLTFDTSSNPTVTAAVGISYTSDANATLNRTHEVHGWDFNAMRKANHDAWNQLFGRVRIGGGTHDQQVQFYTALYHALLHPNVFSDDNGQYMGYDNQVHTLAKGQQAEYANYSGWDIYRSQVQLMAMAEPQVESDVVTSMVNDFDQTGLLPKWAQNNGESYVMVGDPADGIIADAYAFGARSFNTSQALDAMVYEATKPNNNRPGESVREAKGYLPIDGSNWGCCNFYGPVSTQLEYDTADYAIASFAKSLGKNSDYTKFAGRAQDWQNVFNPQSGYMQAKQGDGEWAPGFTPGTANGFVEGTSAQYTPMVPFNIKALIAARGGSQAYSSYLDSLLSNLTNPTSTNADLSNEPSLEIPWEYDYLAQPWKTQAIVRQTQQQLWFNAPVGSFGNDDLGEMSSWYVWSELGMYPQTPGTDTLALGSPVFPEAQLTVAGGHQVTINAPQAAPDAPYVQALHVNGKAWNDSWLTYASLSRGATLDYTLGTTPDTGWASSAGSVPPSDPTGEHAVLASTDPSGSGLVLAPGGTGTGNLDLMNIGAVDSPVKWTAQAPSGVTVQPASGSLTVPAGSTARQEVKVTGGTTEGIFPVTFALSDSSGASLGNAVLRAVVAKPGELWPYATGKGVYPDGSSFTGGFDGQGFAYSQNALAAAGISPGGTVTSGGITYTWPGEASGQNDVIAMAGQTIPADAPAGASTLGLLGAATNAPPTTGTTGQITIHYTDGSTSTATIGFSDWTLNAGASKPIPGDTTVATTPYRDTASGGKQTVLTYVFATTVPVDTGKQVASLTLPVTSDGTADLFALGYGS
ncbi:lectin [Streptomyces sp. RB6PN25]|uniref:Lectin n=1 Tax=Streptomyces humicola TaxID=2953240 RepID=A0ABT1Q322_9ACTN|nr:lectin [Streptomyces humicola]MCQ4083725.1 lectin [Streptomyces humicola]